MIQGTRKLSCSAHTEIKMYEIFPEYSISESVITKSSKLRALRMLKEEKNDMSKEGAIKKREGQICEEIFCIPAHEQST